MIAVGGFGRGLSGCFRYVLGEGRDRETRQLRPAAANDDESRVAWIGGQDVGGWTPQSRDDAETMRRIMEFSARPENQASKTKKCEKDAMHLVLSWRTGETPSREEMEQAAREALGAVGMEKARALFVAHRDTPHAHLHIVASRINPETGRAFSDQFNFPKWQNWCLKWEREHGLIQCPEREKRSQLQAAIEEKNAAAVLDLMTQRQATFTGKELDRELAKALTAKEAAAAFKAELLAQADVLQLHDRDSGKQLDRFTTRGVRAAETKALEYAAALATSHRHQLGARAAAAALAKCPTMRDEQRRAFEHATTDAALAIIDGKAGTGKSYTMGAIRAAYKGDGCRVVGLAPTNAVAQDMQRDGFTEARTIHSALFALKNARDKWDRKTVVMVDEAAMIGTKIMGELLARAHEAGAKLILVGDDRQLASIERGGLFAELRQHHGAAALSFVTRQRDSDHKAAAEMLARGEFAEAVAALDKLGCITRSNHQTESMAALVEQWKADTATAPEKSRLVFAYTNDDVQQLNAELRSVRKERGELGEDSEFTTKDGKAAFAKHDRVVFTTSDKRKGIINGAMGTIEEINGQKITLRMDGKSERRLTFDAAEMPSFRHAYAGTIYKGQGRTFDDVYLYHSQHWKDAAAYVALTRHRDDVKLFVSTEITRDTEDLARQLARHDDRRASLAFATPEEAARQREEKQQQRIEEHQHAAEEVTGHKSDPHHAPPPTPPKEAEATRRLAEVSARQTAAQVRAKEAADRRAERQARYDRTRPAPTEPPKQQPESSPMSFGVVIERLMRHMSEIGKNDPTPARPSERVREVGKKAQGADPPALTARPAPIPLAGSGQTLPPSDPPRHGEDNHRATGGEPMPIDILGAVIAAAIEPSIIDDTADIVREGVGEIAKAAAPEAAPESPPTYQYASLSEWAEAQRQHNQSSIEQQQEQRQEIEM